MNKWTRCVTKWTHFPIDAIWGIRRAEGKCYTAVSEYYTTVFEEERAQAGA